MQARTKPLSIGEVAAFAIVARDERAATIQYMVSGMDRSQTFQKLGPLLLLFRVW